MTTSAVSFDTLTDSLTQQLKDITDFDKTKVVIPATDPKKTQAEQALEDIRLMANKALATIDEWEEG